MTDSRPTDRSDGDTATVAPRRRPPRAPGRPQVLTRDEILTAALRIASSVGLEQLTMRALAADLGVSAMSLYAHVADKDDILDAVIDRRLRESGIPSVDLEWMSWMADAAERLRGLLVHEPALLDRYCRRPVGVPAALDRMEASFTVLRTAGFDDDRSVEMFAAVHSYTIGVAALQVAREAGRRRQPRPVPTVLDESSEHYWPAIFASLDPQQYPELHRLQPDLVTLVALPQFQSGLAALLAGFDAQRVSSSPPAVDCA